MRWPFARSRQRSDEPGHAGAHRDGPVAVATVAPPAAKHVSRRDWATLPPLPTAGARPIALTEPSRAFADQLASRQAMVSTTLPVHVHRRQAWVSNPNAGAISL